MTSTFIWDRFVDHDQVVFAPDVPLEERREPRPGLLPWWVTLRRFKERWEGRAVLLAELADVHHVREVRKACREVWWAAKPLAGVVDLHQLEDQLNDELWTCTQLVIQLARVSREVPNESPARKLILDQIADRKGQLHQLRDEYETLYTEAGADPAERRGAQDPHSRPVTTEPGVSEMPDRQDPPHTVSAHRATYAPVIVDPDVPVKHRTALVAGLPRYPGHREGDIELALAGGAVVLATPLGGASYRVVHVLEVENHQLRESAGDDGVVRVLPRARRGSNPGFAET